MPPGSVPGGEPTMNLATRFGVPLVPSHNFQFVGIVARVPLHIAMMPAGTDTLFNVTEELTFALSALGVIEELMFAFQALRMVKEEDAVFDAEPLEMKEEDTAFDAERLGVKEEERALDIVPIMMEEDAVFDAERLGMKEEERALDPDGVSGP